MKNINEKLLHEESIKIRVGTTEYGTDVLTFSLFERKSLFLRKCEYVVVSKSSGTESKERLVTPNREQAERYIRGRISYLRIVEVK